MNDRAIVATLILSFALLLTVHVTIAFGLLRRAPRWRALAVLLLPPLALYWAMREKMRIRAALWALSGAAYAVALFLASLGP